MLCAVGKGFCKRKAKIPGPLHPIDPPFAPLLRPALLAIREKRLGPNHPETLATREELQNLSGESDAPADAAPKCEGGWRTVE